MTQSEAYLKSNEARVKQIGDKYVKRVVNTFGYNPMKGEVSGGDDPFTVIDNDTVNVNGQSLRMLHIDAPEVSHEVQAGMHVATDEELVERNKKADRLVALRQEKLSTLSSKDLKDYDKLIADYRNPYAILQDPKINKNDDVVAKAQEELDALRATKKSSYIAEDYSKMGRLKETIERGGHYAYSKPGDVSAMAGFLTTVNDDGPNILAGTGQTLQALNTTTGAMEEKKILGSVLEGHDKFDRKFSDNKEYAKYMIENGYAVPFTGDRELAELGKIARAEKRGLWGDDTNGGAAEMEAKYQQRLNVQDKPSGEYDGWAINHLKGLGGSLAALSAKTADTVFESATAIGAGIKAATTDITYDEAKTTFNKNIEKSNLASLYHNGQFTGADEAQDLATYGYSNASMQKDISSWKTVMNDPDSGVFDKVVSSINLVARNGLEVLATSAGDIVAAGSGIGTGVIAANIYNSIINDRADNSEGPLGIADYTIAATASAVYALVNKFTNGNAGLVETKTMIRQLAKSLDKGAWNTVVASLGQIGGKAGVEGLEEIIQGGAEVLGAKLGTLKEHEIATRETALDLGSQGLLGVGGALVTAVPTTVGNVYTARMAEEGVHVAADSYAEAMEGFKAKKAAGVDTSADEAAARKSYQDKVLSVSSIIDGKLPATVDALRAVSAMVDALGAENIDATPEVKSTLANALIRNAGVDITEYVQAKRDALTPEKMKDIVGVMKEHKGMKAVEKLTDQMASLYGLTDDKGKEIVRSYAVKKVANIFSLSEDTEEVFDASMEIFKEKYGNVPGVMKAIEESYYKRLKNTIAGFVDGANRKAEANGVSSEATVEDFDMSADQLKALSTILANMKTFGSEEMTNTAESLEDYFHEKTLGSENTPKDGKPPRKTMEQVSKEAVSGYILGKKGYKGYIQHEEDLNVVAATINNPEFLKTNTNSLQEFKTFAESRNLDLLTTIEYDKVAVEGAENKGAYVTTRGRVRTPSEIVGLAKQREKETKKLLSIVNSINPTDIKMKEYLIGVSATLTGHLAEYAELGKKDEKEVYEFIDALKSKRDPKAVAEDVKYRERKFAEYRGLLKDKFEADGYNGVKPGDKVEWTYVDKDTGKTKVSYGVLSDRAFDTESFVMDTESKDGPGTKSAKMGKVIPHGEISLRSGTEEANKVVAEHGVVVKYQTVKEYGVDGEPKTFWNNRGRILGAMGDEIAVELTYKNDKGEEKSYIKHFEVARKDGVAVGLKGLGYDGGKFTSKSEATVNEDGSFEGGADTTNNTAEGTTVEESTGSDTAGAESAPVVEDTIVEGTNTETVNEDTIAEDTIAEDTTETGSTNEGIPTVESIMNDLAEANAAIDGSLSELAKVEQEIANGNVAIERLENAKTQIIEIADLTVVNAKELVEKLELLSSTKQAISNSISKARKDIRKSTSMVNRLSEQLKESKDAKIAAKAAKVAKVLIAELSSAIKGLNDNLRRLKEHIKIDTKLLKGFTKTLEKTKAEIAAVKAKVDEYNKIKSKAEPYKAHAKDLRELVAEKVEIKKMLKDPVAYMASMTTGGIVVAKDGGNVSVGQMVMQLMDVNGKLSEEALDSIMELMPAIIRNAGSAGRAEVINAAKYFHSFSKDRKDINFLTQLNIKSGNEVAYAGGKNNPMIKKISGIDAVMNDLFVVPESTNEIKALNDFLVLQYAQVPTSVLAKHVADLGKSEEEVAVIRAAYVNFMKDNGIKAPEGNSYEGVTYGNLNIEDVVKLADMKAKYAVEKVKLEAGVRAAFDMATVLTIANMVGLRTKPTKVLEDMVKSSMNSVLGSFPSPTEVSTAVEMIRSGRMVPTAMFRESAGKEFLAQLNTTFAKSIIIQDDLDITLAIGEMVIARATPVGVTDNRGAGIERKAFSKIGGVIGINELTHGGTGSHIEVITFVGATVNGNTADAKVYLENMAKAGKVFEYAMKRENGAVSLEKYSYTADKKTNNGNTKIGETTAEYMTRQGSTALTFSDTFKKEYEGMKAAIRNRYAASDTPIEVDDTPGMTYEELIEELITKEANKEYIETLLGKEEDVLKNTKPMNFDSGVSSTFDGVKSKYAADVLDLQRMLFVYKLVKDQEFYVGWEYTVSNRSMIANSWLNQQNSKIGSRFAVHSTGNDVNYELDFANGLTEDALLYLNLGAAQALEIGVDKLEDANAIKKLNDNFVTFNKHGIENMQPALKSYLEGEVTLASFKKAAKGMGMHTTPETFMHAYQVITLLKKLHDSAPGTNVTTDLRFEVDGITNGMMTTLLQMGLTPETIEDLRKGGLYFGDDVEDVRNHGKFKAGGVDIYETPKKSFTSKLGEKEREWIETLIGGEGKWRNYLKPLVMVYIYGASMFNIKKHASYNLVLAALGEEVVNGEPSPKFEALVNLLAEVSKSKDKEGRDVKRILDSKQYTTYNAKTKSFDKVYTETGMRNYGVNGEIDLDEETKWYRHLPAVDVQILADALDRVIGSSLESAFDESFGHVNEYRRAIKTVEEINYLQFADNFTEAVVAEVGKDNLSSLTKNQLSNIIMKLIEKGQHYAATNSLGELQEYYKVDKKDIDELINVVVPNRGIFQSKTLGKDALGAITNINRIAREIVSNVGAIGVTSAHSVDGSTMILGHYSTAINIFDALVLGINPDINTAQIEALNKSFYEINRRHSILGEAVQRMIRNFGGLEDTEKFKDNVNKLFSNLSPDALLSLYEDMKRIDKTLSIGGVNKVLIKVDGARDLLWQILKARSFQYYGADKGFADFDNSDMGTREEGATHYKVYKDVDAESAAMKIVLDMLEEATNKGLMLSGVLKANEGIINIIRELVDSSGVQASTGTAVYKVMKEFLQNTEDDNIFGDC